MKNLIWFLLIPFFLFADSSVKMKMEMDDGTGGAHGSRYQNFSSDTLPRQKERHFRNKALCVVSPQKEQNHAYGGIGVGSETTQPAAGRLKGRSMTNNTLEGVVGYEFYDDHGHKMTTQIATSQPKAQDPTVCFSLGFGF
ncbi:MAG: hypothetical protein JSS62_04920 [Verrucomicrobia bacterium]|nr:hypothetical protein [Verrucomicrobiota bacterium]MBS0647509.1 hypothetical protein [Verrucomicrobiota bacterium]